MGRKRRRTRKAVVVDLLQTKVGQQRDAAQIEVADLFTIVSTQEQSLIDEFCAAYAFSLRVLRVSDL
jgi:hypothetical protein